MGSTSYSFDSRQVRASTLGYATNTIYQNFTQNVKRMIHESMIPSKALLRESRDSVTHPNSVPIIIALDVTGSMLGIPQELVIKGLPKMMAGIIQRGILDPQVLFLAIGDHTCDNYPLQVGQFESGDEELDMWLTRTYLEGGGGGNAGESYLLAWYFGGNHTVTDAWEKRKQKGFLFTIGDEPCLQSLPSSAINEIMGVTPQAAYKLEDVLEKAKETYNVFHLHVMEGTAGPRSLQFWKNLLGQNCIEVKHHEDISKIIADIVVSNTNIATPVTAPVAQTVTTDTGNTTEPTKIML